RLRRHRALVVPLHLPMRASILICADSASSLFYHSINSHCAQPPRCKGLSIIFCLLVLLRYVSRHSDSLTSLLLQGANQSISRHRKLSKEHQQHGQRLLQLWRFFAPGTSDRSYSSCIPLLSFRLRSEEHTSELQSHRDLHSFPTRRSSDLHQQHGQRLLQLWRFFAPGTSDRSYSSCIPLLSFRL